MQSADLACCAPQSRADPLPAIGGRRAKSRCYLNPGFGCLRCSRRRRFVAWVMRRRLSARTGPRRLTPRARRQGCPAGDRWSRSGISSTLGASCNSHCSATCGGVTPDWAALWMTTGPVSTGLATPRGPALARPILLAVGLNVAAVRGARRHRRFPRRLYVADQDSVAVAVRGAGRAGDVGGRLLPRLPVDLGLRRRL